MAKTWIPFLRYAAQMPNDACAGMSISEGVDVRRCVKLLLQRSASHDHSPQSSRDDLAALLARGHIGENMYRHTSEVLDALEDSWRIDRSGRFIATPESDWHGLPNGGHVRRNHLYDQF